MCWSRRCLGDARGWFMESWSKRKMEEAGIHVDFVQDNQSYSAQKGTLRGLHYQLNPMCQAKLLRATRGTIFDVAVDIRKGSPQFGQWVGVELSAENKKQLFIPRGFVARLHHADGRRRGAVQGGQLRYDAGVRRQHPLGVTRTSASRGRLSR